jgi:hypothetical protein
MKNIILTDHAVNRIKERIGIKKKAAPRIAEKAWLNGISHSDTRGKLNRFITSLFFKYKTANNIKIYGKHIFIFCGSTLVTVLHLPKF